MMTVPGDRSGPAWGGWWLPLIIVVVSFFILMAFETGHAIRERGALSDLRRSQEPTVQESIRLRQQLETLAAKTAQLAADGDEGAKTVADQMKRQGVTLTPPKQ
jgi:hypothetical protein